MTWTSSLISRRAAIGSIAGALAALHSSPTLAQRPLALGEIVRRNTDARGGAAALERMRAIAVDVEIAEGGQTLNGRYTATKEGLVRIDIYVDGKSVFSEGVDGDGGWMWTGGSAPPKPSVEAGRAALLNGAENHLFGWHRFAERGHKLALMPPEAIDGTSFQVVELRYATGQASYFYVDPVSWQAVRRRDERAYHPDVSLEKQRIESRSIDFQKVDGIVAAHRNEDYDLGTGKLLSVNRVLQRRINPGLTADHFDRNRRAPPTW